MYKLFAALVVILLSGCAAQQYDNNRLAESLQFQPPTIVLEQLQKTKPASRDKVQFQLNMGYLQFITGDFASAIITLNDAKQGMKALSATSISENIGAGAVSETLRQYSGYPTDRVMVHNILALSYLFSGQIYDARVEILQSEVAIKALMDNDQNGQLASAHLLGGIIYELLGEYSNALISYKDAADTIKKRSMNLPVGLKQALVRVTYQLGATEQYRQYQQQFPEIGSSNTNANNQVFVLYFDGVVSHKVESSVIVPSTNAQQIIRISMPAYPNNNKPFKYIQVSDTTQSSTSQVIEDVDLLVREDLAKDYPSILLLTSTRAIAKYQLVRNAQKQDPLIGLLANLVTVVSENADLRSWNMLPATIQFAYLTPKENSIMVNKGHGIQESIDTSGGRKHVLLINGLSNAVFHYQQ
ncbi:COG3014 family protein [Psychromonas sp. PT13]|uniref:COG3014 family protein n=1 Tax=Psychromonas sp. PT13 TaxID=3439547 RepID=UPI003EBDA0FC